MLDTFNELVAYLKNPVLEKDPNNTPTHRLTKFFHIFLISVITGIILTPVLIYIESSGLVNMDDHAMKELARNFSKAKVLFLTVIVAPLIEELIFRAPITLFHSQKAFKIAFYVFAIVFGLVHLTNFTITTNVILLAPILVAPQIILGGYLGFIRVRFGLGWSILLHASYNCLFILFSFASDFT
ncbi:CPBP family intramembrane glutamic endopeptidase [Tenacibaculum amylolyticum]|uniref:CPBP family intramembrane glutamic endopeptidase n=1 Tax=Tenacibaculum amylolyticum TaxID=104269 RepID=UPI0038966179